MNAVAIAGFLDEFEKIAGVGVDIHGYRTDPGSPDAKDVLDQMDQLDRARALRVKTPYDRASSLGYKLHMDTLRGQTWDNNANKWRGIGKPSSILTTKATDHAYSDKLVTRNLNRGDVRKLIKDYRANSAQIKNPDYRKVQSAFINKAGRLMKDKNVKVMRLEYE